MRVSSLRQANLRASNVVHRVEPLEERHAVDEVKTVAGHTAQVAHDEIDAV